MLKKSRCCNCKCSHGEFTPAVHLEKSGITIYFHEDELLQQRRIGEENRRSIILYNSGDKELKRSDLIAELCRCKTNCFKCTAMIQQVRKLLDDISTVRKHQIIGICEYCKRPNMRNKCKRCEHIANKFIINKVEECKNHEERFISWISKIKRFLISIMQGKVICKHNISLDYKTRLQLDNLLQNLQSSLPVKQPQIEVYSDRVCLQSSENSIFTRKKVLDELILKLNSDNKIGINIEENLSNRTTMSEISCGCKYFKNDKTESFQTKDIIQIKQSKYELSDNLYEPFTLPLVKETKTQGRTKDLTKKQTKSLVDTQIDKTKRKEKKSVAEIDTSKQKTFKKEAVKQTISTAENYQIDKVDKTENEAKITMHKNNEKRENFISKKQKLTSNQITAPKVKKNVKQNIELSSNSSRLSETNNEKKPQEKLLIRETIPNRIPLLADILNNKVKYNNNIGHEENSISTMECASNREYITEMIKGNKILGHVKDFKDVNEIKKPLLYKILADCTKSLIPTEGQKSLLDEEIISEHPNQADTGAIFYKLSDWKFIENGWTKLPTTKIMRRMNIYKMLPSNEAFDWFRNHKEKILFYNSGGKLAEVFENGSGKWFYENGDIALDRYNAKDITSEKRYIIYSSSEDENIFLHKKKSVTILGCFDSHGNGVVYDYSGKPRLKYNQSEGLVIDKTIGPPGRWKWHTLNDPPELVHAVVETEVERDPCLQKFVSKTDNIKVPDEEMIAIEYDHFVRKRAKKTLQEYKPFEIRMKALKINNNFSLRIVNQSKIYLQFRCGRYNFKQNVGMILQSDKIIDTVNVDFGDVTTPYDRTIPNSDSIAAIQNMLLKAKYSRKKD